MAFSDGHRAVDLPCRIKPENAIKKRTLGHTRGISKGKRMHQTGAYQLGAIDSTLLYDPTLGLSSADLPRQNMDKPIFERKPMQEKLCEFRSVQVIERA